MLIPTLYRSVLTRVLAIVCLSYFCGCGPVPSTETETGDGVPIDTPTASATPIPVPRTREQSLGTHFSADGPRFERAPTLQELPIPRFDGAHAIWGGLGRDDAGNLFFGVSVDSARSATLLKLPTDASELSIAANAISQLKASGQVLAPELTQKKIHSKLCAAADGNLYFSSMDEEGENTNGSKLPTWGSHLWRIRPGVDKWEHLLAAPEALIAVGSTGRFVYALGYFNHVVYQYDTRAGTIRNVAVGSHAGHISRNLLVDINEHVYVPRVEALSSDSNEPSVSDVNGKPVRSSLVEFDTDLQQVGSWPLSDYEPTASDDSHGIVGFATLANGDLVFTTHSGACWHIHPETEGGTQLDRLGWFHPSGRAYPSALFCPTGSGFITGIAQLNGHKFEWVRYDLASRQGSVLEWDEESKQHLAKPGLLLYGTNTMDDQGRAYLVGVSDSSGPCILRATWPAIEE